MVSSISSDGTDIEESMIKGIKEIAGNHSDEDIYAMLQDCSMDPNEAVQRLLYLDTFHEVKGKRERRKENVDRSTKNVERRTSGEATRMQGSRARGVKGNRGSYSTNAISQEIDGEKAAVAAKENGVSLKTVKGFPLAPPKLESKVASQIPRSSTVKVNGFETTYNGNETPAWATKALLDGMKITANGSSLKTVKSDVYKHSSVSARTTSADFQMPTSGVDLIPKLKGTIPVMNDVIQTNPGITQQANGLASNMTPAAGETVIVTHEKLPFQTQVVDSYQLSANDHDDVCTKPADQVVVNKDDPAPAVTVSNKATPKLHISDGHQVTFPNHFQVPEALNHGLAFGSFDSTLEPDGKFVDGCDDPKASNAVAGSCQENNGNATEPSLRLYQNGFLAAQEGDSHGSVNGQSLPSLLDSVARSDGGVSPDAVPKLNPAVPEKRALPERGCKDVVQQAANYTFGFLPPSQGGNPLVLSSSTPNQAISQPSGVDQSSIIHSPQVLPVFRHAYPMNYFPYSHYFPHYFLPPVPPIVGPASFSLGQQPSPGNVSLPSAIALASGIKYSNPQYEPESQTGIQNHIGVPSVFGPYSSPAFPYSPRSAMISPSVSGDEDAVVSHLKENIIYTTAQQTEGSSVWVPGTGQDISAMQLNPFYNLPQGQPITFPPVQVAHGAFAGIYQPAQTIAAPQLSTGQPFQQSLTGSVECNRTPSPSSSHQLPQSQISQNNWTGANDRSRDWN